MGGGNTGKQRLRHLSDSLPYRLWVWGHSRAREGVGQGVGVGDTALHIDFNMLPLKTSAKEHCTPPAHMNSFSEKPSPKALPEPLCDDSAIVKSAVSASEAGLIYTTGWV